MAKEQPRPSVNLKRLAEVVNYLEESNDAGVARLVDQHLSDPKLSPTERGIYTKLSGHLSRGNAGRAYDSAANAFIDAAGHANWHGPTATRPASAQGPRKPPVKGLLGKALLYKAKRLLRTRVERTKRQPPGPVPKDIQSPAELRWWRRGAYGLPPWPEPKPTQTAAYVERKMDRLMQEGKGEAARAYATKHGYNLDLVEASWKKRGISAPPKTSPKS